VFIVGVADDVVDPTLKDDLGVDPPSIPTHLHLLVVEFHIKPIVINVEIVVDVGRDIPLDSNDAPQDIV
jgi:hypothetical protein